MLGEGKLASGITLDRGAAENALAPLGAELGFTVEETARGIMTIAAANMATRSARSRSSAGGTRARRA